MAGAAELRLAIQITANDATGGAFKAAEQKTQRFAKNTRKEFKSLLDVGSSYRKLVGAIVTGRALAKGFSYLENTIIDVKDAIVGMDTALVAASAKWGTMTYKGTENFAEMQRVTRDISGTTEFTSSQVAKGMDFLAMAGFGFEQSMKAMRPLTDLATASQMDLARASDIASDALGAFSMSTEPQDIEKNLGRINDVFAATVTSSNTTMETLFDTMKLAGPVTKGGVTMFGTLAGTLGSAGIKGTIAATTMKNMFLRLQAPPSEAAKALKKLRVEIDDGTGEMDSMINIIGKLNVALAGKNAIQREKFLKDIFGMRAIAGVNVLLKTGKDALQKYHDELDASEGKAKEMADTMRNSLGVQLEVLHSTIMSRGMDIFTGLMGKDDPVDAVKELIDVIREFDVSPIVNALKEVGRFAKGTAEFLWENRQALKAFAQVWMIANVSGKLQGVANSLLDVNAALAGGGGSAGLTGGLGLATKNMGALVKEVGLFQAGMQTALPLIGSFVAGLTVGHEIWMAIERKQKEEQNRQNKEIRAAFGKTATGEEMSYSQAKTELNVMLERRKRAMVSERVLAKASGQKYTPEYLLTGELSQNKQFRIQQEKARGLQRHMNRIKRKEEETMRTRLSYLSGEGPTTPTESSADFWRGEMPEANESWKKYRGVNVGDQTTPLPQITWDPKQEFKVNVQINGAQEGTTATASVEKVPTVSEKALGMPNG